MPAPRRPLIVWVPESLLYRMAEEAEAHVPNESGGVLLGYRNGRHVVVRSAIDAGPAATRWPEGMLPDTEYQERAIENAWWASAGAVSYLGDWHSHPMSLPIPSPRDRRTLRNIALDREAFCAEPVMLILGSEESGTWLSAAWVGGLGRLGRFGRLKVEAAMLRRQTTETADVRAAL